MHDQETNIVHCGTCACYVDGLGSQYRDKHGDTWVRISALNVLRLSDGILGKFFARQGLELVAPLVISN